MELNIKFNEKMLVETANRVLDEYKYNGKTIREWADLIANPKTNADRIRAMPDAELAEFLQDVAMQGGIELGGRPITWFDWLRQEAEHGCAD